MWQYNYDYLEHHGILGQKWGVRRFQNPDGSLTAAGKLRYNKQNSALDELITKIHTYDNNTTPESIIRNIGKITKNSELTNGLYKLTKQYRSEKKDIASEFDSLVNFKDKDEKTFYEASSEIVECLNMYGKKKETMGDVAWHMYLGVYEDGQQGRSNAYSLKAHDNGVTDKVQKLDERQDNAYRKFNEDITQLLTKECPNINESTAKRLAVQINDSENWNKTETTLYRLRDASLGDQLNKSIEQINFAKNVCTKLKDCQSNWDALNGVIEDLGFENKMPDELTASDWKKINKAVNEYYY